MPSGHSGNWSLGSNHAAPSDRQMCTLGHAAIGASRQPIRSRMVSLPSRAATICEPHWVQKYRVLPGEDSKPLSRLSPLVQRKRSRGTLVTVEKADLCVLQAASSQHGASSSNKNPARDIILGRDFRTLENRVAYFRLSI